MIQDRRVLTVERVPTCAPELNPVEFLGGALVPSAARGRSAPLQ